MRKFLINTLIFLVPIILVIISVNYFVDPAKIFDKKHINEIIDIIKNGSYVTNLKNYNERLFQKNYITDISIKHDVVFIGSSRGMLINESFFPNKNFYNHGVSGACIYDIIGIYQLLKQNNKIPKRIIIGIDPWIFNDNHGQIKWRVFQKEINTFLNSHALFTFPETYKYQQLFSLSYFQISFSHLINKKCGNHFPTPTMKINNKLNTKLLDGSIDYGYQTYKRPEQIIKNRIQNELSRSMYRISEFKAVSEQLQTLFTKLIKYMISNDIEVEFYIEPYHPLLYNRVKKQYPLVIKTENLINKIADSNKISVYGSFNPNILNIKGDQFYNGLHCKEDAVRFIIQQNRE